MHVFISAGEPSGDLHGANLIRQLKAIDPAVRLSGFGGDRMAAAGCQLLYPLCNHSVMWFLDVFKQIFTFVRLLNEAQAFFKAEKPDVIVVIRCPAAALTGSEHERVGVPLRCTVHAPHWPMPQPYFVPTSPR